MRVTAILGVAAMALWPSLAQATDTNNFAMKTTQDLFQVCATAQNDPMRAQAIEFCEGFLLGVVLYHDEIVSRTDLKRLICYPQGVTRDQGIQAFIDWAKTHQADQKFMGDPPVVGAVRGLASKWPCPK